jgi:hypothetical protein
MRFGGGDNFFRETQNLDGFVKVMFWTASKKVRDTACESRGMKRTYRTLQ